MVEDHCVLDKKYEDRATAAEDKFVIKGEDGFPEKLIGTATRNINDPDEVANLQDPDKAESAAANEEFEEKNAEMGVNVAEAPKGIDSEKPFQE